MLRFDGLVAVITGAGRGMGREHALLLAARGCRVVVNDPGVRSTGSASDADPAAEVVDTIVRAGGTAIGDHRSVVDGAEAIVRGAVDEFGRLDILINNAGTFTGGYFSDTPAAVWDGDVDVHYGGTVAMCRAAWPHLVRGGRGRIVNTSSSGMFGGSHLTSYGSAKAAIFGFTRSLALEARAYGIGVNAIMPTAWTRMTERIEDPSILKVLQTHFQPEHVSPLVAWLAHPLTMVTGEIFRTSGSSASRVATATTASVRASEDTPEAWAELESQLLTADGLVELRSNLDSFARELWEVDPTLDLREMLSAGGLMPMRDDLKEAD
jgi:NAD(P)-dependent dehydrogenase (short-subunit alcohol dehydrogenase family)